MKRFLLFMLAAVMFAACAEDALNEQTGIQPIIDDAPDTLTVGFEEDETRIQLNEATKTVWTYGDLVSVFYRSNANQKWEFQGNTGDRQGKIKRVENSTPTETMHRTVVVYPYNENYYINPKTYNIDATLPATQHYLKDSYGCDGNIMVAQSEFTKFSLKSVCGWLKLQLTGNGEKVKSVTFKGNNGEQVAGLIYVNTSDATAILASEMGDVEDDEIGGVGGSLVFDDTILTEVVLNCGEGVALGPEATSFYIALPPQTFSNGFTVTVTTTDGEEMTKLTDKEVVIERNHIQPMAALKYHCTTPENNEIWYTNGSTTTATEPDATNGFGANILSNTYDADKECWVITFDGDVTKIGDDAFIDRGSLTSVTIPNSVTSLERSAFFLCSNLKSITLSDNLTTIGVQAFSSCTSLTSVTIPEGVTKIGACAFYDCTSLTNVYCKPTTPPTGGGYMFYYNASGRKIYVPVGSGDDYKAADYWKDYADYIEEKEL